MTLKMPLADQSRCWKTIKLNEDDQFEIELVKPTWDDLNSEPGNVEDRLQKHLVNWRGVIDESENEIPFSWESFQALCVKITAVFQIAAGHVYALYSAMPEAEEKNSPAPAADS